MSETLTMPSATPDPDRAEQLRRRGLFAFHDGYRPRMADLIVTQMRIQDVLPGGDMSQLDTLLEIAAGVEDKEQEQPPQETIEPRKWTTLTALVRVSEIVAVGFDLPALDEVTGQGLSVQERVDLLSHFLSTAPDAEADDDEESDDDGNAPSETATETNPSATTPV